MTEAQVIQDDDDYEVYDVLPVDPDCDKDGEGEGEVGE